MKNHITGPSFQAVPVLFVAPASSSQFICFIQSECSCFFAVSVLEALNSSSCHQAPCHLFLVFLYQNLQGPIQPHCTLLSFSHQCVVLFPQIFLSPLCYFLSPNRLCGLPSSLPLLQLYPGQFPLWFYRRMKGTSLTYLFPSSLAILKSLP